MQDANFGLYLNQITLEYNPVFLAKLQVIDNTSKIINELLNLVEEKYGKIKVKARIIGQEIPIKPVNIELSPLKISQKYLFRLFVEHFNRFEFILKTHGLNSKNGHFNAQIDGRNFSFWGGCKNTSNSIFTIEDTINKIEYGITIRKGLEESIKNLSDFKDGYIKLVKRKLVPNLCSGNPYSIYKVVYSFFSKGQGFCYGTINRPFKTIPITPDLISLLNNLLDIADKIIISKAMEAKSLN